MNINRERELFEKSIKFRKVHDPNVQVQESRLITSSLEKPNSSTKFMICSSSGVPSNNKFKILQANSLSRAVYLLSVLFINLLG